MMITMGGHPIDGPALTGKHSANREKIFKPFGALKTAVSQQPVIA